MAERGKYVRKVYTLTCEWCHEKFESKVHWAKYCSDAHEQKAYRQRVQEQRAVSEREVSDTRNR